MDESHCQTYPYAQSLARFVFHYRFPYRLKTLHAKWNYRHPTGFWRRLQLITDRTRLVTRQDCSSGQRCKKEMEALVTCFDMAGKRLSNWGIEDMVVYSIFSFLWVRIQPSYHASREKSTHLHFCGFCGKIWRYFRIKHMNRRSYTFGNLVIPFSWFPCLYIAVG